MKKLTTIMVAVAMMCCGSMAYATITPGTTTVSTFTGGDVGEGLDLTGTFVKAIDAGWTGPAATGGGTVQGVTFAYDAQTPEGDDYIKNTGTDFSPRYTTIEYGNTANDNALEDIMNNATRSAASGATFLAAFRLYGNSLTIGQEYKLQVGLQGVGGNKCWDILMSDGDTSTTILVDNLAIADSTSLGTLVTYEFTWDAGDAGTLNRMFFVVSNCTNQGDTSIPADHDARYPQFQLVTLEAIPEPATMALLGLGSAFVLRRKKK